MVFIIERTGPMGDVMLILPVMVANRVQKVFISFLLNSFRLSCYVSHDKLFSLSCQYLKQKTPNQFGKGSFLGGNGATSDNDHNIPLAKVNL